MSLIRRDDSTLLVIDTQEGFYGDERGDVDRAAFELFVARVAWVSGLARALEIPAVVTEEDPETNGPTAPACSRACRPAPPCSPSRSSPLPTIPRSGRRWMRRASHSRRRRAGDRRLRRSFGGLADRARVPRRGRDRAVFSPGAAHGHGLDRLRAEGVQLLSAKELFYDWARALADVRALVLAYPELETPPGFSL